METFLKWTAIICGAWSVFCMIFTFVAIFISMDEDVCDAMNTDHDE
jgi:hypothetical protein